MRLGRSIIHGFTLIELLVVISIISLLISILLPALRQARESAQATVCTSQIRQVSLGNYLYANDYDGYAPWFGDPGVGLPPIGTQRLSGTRLQNNADGAKWPYGEKMIDPGYWSATILHCPARPGYPQIPTRLWLSWDTAAYTVDGSPYTLQAGVASIASSYWTNPFGDEATSTAGGASSPYWNRASSSTSGRWAWRIDDSRSSSVFAWDLYLNATQTLWINDHPEQLILSFVDGSAGSERYSQPELLPVVPGTDDAIRRICSRTGSDGLRRDNQVRPWQ